METRVTLIVTKIDTIRCHSQIENKNRGRMSATCYCFYKDDKTILNFVFSHKVLLLLTFPLCFDCNHDTRPQALRGLVQVPLPADRV